MPRHWRAVLPSCASAHSRLRPAKQLDKGATWRLCPQPRPRSWTAGENRGVGAGGRVRDTSRIC
jgi:hypothetical protein